MPYVYVQFNHSLIISIGKYATFSNTYPLAIYCMFGINANRVTKWQDFQISS